MVAHRPLRADGRVCGQVAVVTRWTTRAARHRRSRRRQGGERTVDGLRPRCSRAGVRSPTGWQQRCGSDPERVRRIWPPGANIGVGCRAAGVVGIALDRHGGPEGIARLHRSRWAGRFDGWRRRVLRRRARGWKQCACATAGAPGPPIRRGNERSRPAVA
ncbi:bifunctional DNA primase/polymerase [Alloactinosynnema sp. L-07]|uniref:bifunctional DNA primase/polymerase n=1 Tax=Alloactinosynnema sp. L-07 TaxID=1653480 RepID=UPI00350EB0B8